MRDMVLILNYDDNCSRAIARSLRAEHVYCKIVSGAITPEEIISQEPLGLILSGGVSGGVPSGLNAGVPGLEYPLLALGDAAAMLCRAQGGDALETAIGNSIAQVKFAACPLTEGLDDCERMLHAVRRLRLPEGARALAEAKGETVGFMDNERPLYGVQFTLEQNDTDGMRLLLNFVLSVCGCTRWWDFEAFVARAVEEITRVVGENGRAVCAMTGGLDSGVSAVLAHRALGSRLKCIFIDTGLMRENEGSAFMAYYRDKLGLDILHVHAQDRFIDALEGVTDPTEKRWIIGNTLQSTLDEALSSLGTFSIIIRGTTCSDIMAGDEWKKRPGLRGVPYIEPLRELFKDEIRRAGEFMGMPQEVISRQTFPGSGLALRILGDVTRARLQTLRACDLIFTDEVAASGQGKRLWQHFAVLSAMPGDDTHAVIALRAVHASDSAQAAYAARMPYDLLERVMQRILRERPEVIRVVYDLTPSSRYAGVEWQ